MADPIVVAAAKQLVPGLRFGLAQFGDRLSSQAGVPVGAPLDVEVAVSSDVGDVAIVAVAWDGTGNSVPPQDVHLLARGKIKKGEAWWGRGAVFSSGANAVVVLSNDQQFASPLGVAVAVEGHPAGSASANTGAALGGSLFQQAVHTAQQLADQAVKDAGTTWDAMVNLASEGAGDAVALLAGKLSPDELLSRVAAHMNELLLKLDPVVNQLWPVIQDQDGKVYQWSDARTDPHTLLWYLGQVALHDADRFASLLGVHLHGYDDVPPAAELANIEPVTITLIVIAIIVLAAILTKKFAKPNTVAAKAAGGVLAAAQGVLKIGPGDSSDSGGKDDTPPPSSLAAKPDNHNGLILLGLALFFLLRKGG